jgi:hypothetical protein
MVICGKSPGIRSGRSKHNLSISHLAWVAPAGLTNPATMGLDLRPKGVQAELAHAIREILVFHLTPKGGNLSYLIQLLTN